MAELDLENARGEPVAAAEAFDNKVVGLYFTAGTAPRACGFRPRWRRFRRSARGTLTVVVSGDASADAADAGFAAIAQGVAAAGTRTDSLSPTLRVPSTRRTGRRCSARSACSPSPRCTSGTPPRRRASPRGGTAVSFNRRRCVAQWHMGQAGWEVGVFDWLNPLPQCVSLASFAQPPEPRGESDARDEETETLTTAPKAVA